MDLLVAEGHAQPLEKELPGGNGSQWQRGRLRVRKRFWLASHETFVYQLKLRIAACAGHAPCVEHVVPNGEIRYVRTYAVDRSGSIKPQDA